MNPNARETPWGTADRETIICHGVTRYDTSSHGGYHVSAQKLAQMPEHIRNLKTWAGEGWYEEDCDWCLVVLAFPAEFNDADRFFAVETARHSHPVALSAADNDFHAAYVAEHGDNYMPAGGMTHTKDGVHGWIQSAVQIGDQSKRLNVWFPHVCHTPATPFTEAQLRAAPLVH